MNHVDRTSMAGGGAWKTTRWSDIQRARTDHPDRRRDVLNDLFRDYWMPAYCYFRRAGFDNETAKDLTQDFFATIDRRQLVQRADPTRGRFRALMLTALKHHAAQWHRRRGAECRRHELDGVSLEGLPRLPEQVTFKSPEAAFDYAWAASLIDRAIETTRTRCLDAGQQVHWTVFYRRDLAPLTEGLEPPDLPELAARLNVDPPERLSAMRVTALRQFRRVLTELVEETLEDDEEAELEIRNLISTLAGSS